MKLITIVKDNVLRDSKIFICSGPVLRVKLKKQLEKRYREGIKGGDAL